MKYRLGLAAVLALALALRLRLLTTDIYLDEAWYFYLARGATPLDEPLMAGPRVMDPFLHFMARPLTYLVFWPAAQLGLTAVRLQNVLLGCAVVGMVAHICRAWGLKPPYALFAALLCAVNPPLVLWSTYFFPDTLGVLLVLSGLLAFVRERPRLCALSLSGAILAKEVFLASWIAALLGSPRNRWLLLAPFPYALLYAYVFVYRGMPGQGWAGAPPLDYGFARSAGFDVVGAGLTVALLFTPGWRVALWGLALPVLFGVRELAFTPGVKLWFAVDCRPQLAITLAGGLQRVPKALALVLAAVSLWSSLTFERPERSRAERLTHDLRELTAQLEARKPQQLLLVGVTWQAPAYPFSDLVPRVEAAEEGDAPRLQSLLPRSEYVLVEHSGPRRFVPFEPLVELVFMNGTYQLYRVKAP